MNAEIDSPTLISCCATSAARASSCCPRYDAAFDDAPGVIAVLVQVAEAGGRFLRRNAAAALKAAAAPRQ